MRKKQIFLSHAWGIDESGRNNHDRVKLLAYKLRRHGYTVWFDDDDMIGNIDKSIIDGINKCEIVIFCLTTKYCNKINTAVNNDIPNDTIQGIDRVNSESVSKKRRYYSEQK